MDENIPESVSQQHELSEPVNKKYSPKSIAIFIGGILLFSAILLYSFNSFTGSSQDSDQEEGETEEAAESIASNTIVYGSWTTDESHIFARDLSTGEEGLLAKLPSNIKKVSVLSPDTLIYINNTDVRDYGYEVVAYSVSKGNPTVLFQASEGFGIDDYVLSPNKQFISLWEVQVNPDSGVLANGKSRVYTGQVSQPNIKNLIYDEVSQNTPVHYPVAILDNGTVFMDRFLPNSGAGWAYGMSMSDFSGTQKTEITSMANGTYGTQPVISPDGSFFAFAGYDGSKGSGTVEKSGFRQAMLTPNTIELLDTQTLTREAFPNVSESDIYSDIKWDESGQNIQVKVISEPSSKSGNYTYSVFSRTPEKILETEEAVTSVLSDDLVLVSTEADDVSPLGNLGNMYEAAITNLSVKNPRTGKSIPLSLTPQVTQMIDTVPSNFFPNLNPIQPTAKENLQLETFVIKPTLEPQREVQQSSRSTERCRDLATAQCNEKLGTSFEPPPNRNHYKSEANTNNAEFSQCYTSQDKENRGKCSDSPLYLYGPAETKITVKVHTPIFNSSAQYNNGYHATLLGDGKFKIGEKTHASVDFDYTPALRRIIPPQQGTVVPVSKLEETLRVYSKNLGLNQKETFDLVQYGKTEVSGPFVFVSFFDHETSHALLPMTFEPKPDTYRNIVFYFRNVTAPYSVAPPSFDKIKRGELTVIEISGMVE